MNASTDPPPPGPRVALVTGGNRGLGYAICAELARRGVHVVVGARDARAADEAAAQIGPAAGSCWGQQIDVTDPASVARAVADTATTHGRLDILVNNAGVAVDRRQLAVSPDMERVRATLDTNLLGAWRCAAAVIPEMRRHGYGRIVNVTSHLGTTPRMGTGNVSYRVSKAALNALTVVLAAELADENILVNAASPGRVATRMAQAETDLDPAAVAPTFAWLATLPDDGPTGGLFHQGERLPW